MHEQSVVQALIRQVVRLQERSGAVRVLSIHVCVGEFSGVDAELLRIAYDDIVTATPLHAARLEVETVRLRARCERCRAEFPVVRFRFVCPQCGEQKNVTILRGEELTLERIEVETEEP